MAISSCIRACGTYSFFDGLPNLFFMSIYFLSARYIVAAVLLINLINPRILWYIDAWKYKGTEKGEPSPGYLFGCRILSALGLIILALVLYFRPIHLKDLGSADAEIRITKQHIYVENGEPFIDSENYDDLSEEQTKSVRDCLRQFTYRRRPGTVFSDGSLTDIGEWLLEIHIYEDKERVRTVLISDAGEISVNNKSYVMQNSSELIREISKII